MSPAASRALPVPGRRVVLGASVVWAGALLAAPLAVLLAMSTGSRPSYGMGVAYDGSMEGWRWVARHGDVVRSSARDSVTLAGIATALAVLLATPVAWWIASAPPRRRALRLLLVVLPSWTSFVLRTFAWRFLLGNEGPVEGALASVGIGPLHALHTRSAVVLGLLYGYLPFAVLPIYVAVERLDRDLLAAARDLGAGPVATYLRVALPLTAVGTVAGALLVFVPCVAAFVTPDLLGPADVFMLGQLVQDRFLSARDWAAGAALGVGLALVAFAALLPLRRRARA